MEKLDNIYGTNKGGAYRAKYDSDGNINKLQKNQKEEQKQKQGQGTTVFWHLLAVGPSCVHCVAVREKIK